MKLYLIRHGQSTANTLKLLDENTSEEDKTSLTDEGIKQAEELARKLESYKISLVIRSPRKRTTETIKPYLETKKVKVLVSELVSERKPGVFGGKPRTEMEEYWKNNKITNTVSFRPEGGESIIDVYERAKKFLVYIKEEHKDKSILVCSHAYFLRCLDIAIKKLEIMNFYSVKGFSNGELREYEI